MSEITLNRIGRRAATITIKGTAPLICHRFDEKARQMMLDKQMGKTVPKKAPKDPDQQYLDSMYTFDDEGGYGFPATAFKAATIGAARYFDSVKMTELRRALFFVGHGPEQLVRIQGTPKMREDVVRVGMGTADIRFRGQFDDWQVDLSIVYVDSMLSLESLVALVDAGGMGGVGEWRPGKSDSGSFGTYEVVGENDEGAA